MQYNVLPVSDQSVKTSWSPVRRLLQDSLLKDSLLNDLVVKDRPTANPNMKPVKTIARLQTKNYNDRQKRDYQNQRQERQVQFQAIEKDKKDREKQREHRETVLFQRSKRIPDRQPKLTDRANYQSQRLQSEQTQRISHAPFKELYYAQKKNAVQLKQKLSELQKQLQAKQQQRKRQDTNMAQLRGKVQQLKKAIPEKKSFQDRIKRLQLELNRAEAKASLLETEQEQATKGLTSVVIRELGQSIQTKDRRIRQLQQENQRLKKEQKGLLIVKNPPGRRSISKD